MKSIDIGRLNDLANARSRFSTHWNSCVYRHPWCAVSWLIEERKKYRRLRDTEADLTKATRIQRNNENQLRKNAETQRDSLIELVEAAYGEGWYTGWYSGHFHGTNDEANLGEDWPDSDTKELLDAILQNKLENKTGE